MRKIGLLFFFAAYVVMPSLHAQENDGSEVLENIHLHLNKTTFLKGERIWFKAYVQDQRTKQPSFATSNLHVAIYDEDDRELKQKLLYVENGISNGDFAIDSTFTKSKYRIVAWTNYMRNFQKLEPFEQQFSVLQEIGFQDETIGALQIAIYPEGGELIADSFNQFGIRVSNLEGRPIKLDNLKLVDENGNVVRSNIKTNSRGLGKVGFNIELNKRYHIEFTDATGQIVKKALPEPKKEQVGLNLDNNAADKILIRLVASSKTLEEKDGEMYSLAVYKDDFVILKDLELNEDEVVVSLDRNTMPFGINTLVLFNSELKPIAHRMFFNHIPNSNRVLDLELEHCMSEFGDSLQVDLILSKGLNTNGSLSISVLPESSKAYKPDNSLTSSFLLQPYLTEKVEGHYYFEGMDRKKRFELDKLLLIEGWGKYDWDSRTFEEVKTEFLMENGIPFKGKVIDADLSQEKQISLIAELSEQIGFEDLQDDKSFSGTMSLYEGDSLGISLISKEGKLRKPIAELSFGKAPLPLKVNYEWRTKELINTQNENPDEDDTQPLRLGERIIALEEVVVSESALKMKRTDMFVPRGTLMPISEGRIITDAEIKKHNTVAKFLSSLGYNRTMGYDSEGVLINMLLSPKSNRPVSADQYLLDIPLSRVQAIYYDVDKIVYVSIQLRSDAYVRPEDRNKFMKFAIANGYARPQEYFSPAYPDYEASLFKDFGALDWKANVNVNSEIPTSIMVPIKNQEGMHLYIEGLTVEGNLISMVKKVEF